MKTLKKTLCLVLAVVMVVGVLILPASAVDATATVEYDEEAANLLQGMGILLGDEDGVSPEKAVTRAQAATFMARLVATPAFMETFSSTSTPFTDCGGVAWAVPSIAYCFAQHILQGTDKGFEPDRGVTGHEMAKMLLCAMGYDAEKEGFIGVTFETNVEILANKTGVSKGIKNLKAPLIRADVITMINNALNAKMVWYGENGKAQEYEDQRTLYTETYKGQVLYGVVVGNQATGLKGTNLKKIKNAITDDILSFEDNPVLYNIETGLDMIGHVLKVYYADAETVYLSEDASELKTVKDVATADIEAKIGKNMQKGYVINDYNPVMKSGGEWTVDGTGSYIVFNGKVVAKFGTTSYTLTKVTDIDATKGTVTLDSTGLTLAEGETLAALSNNATKDIVDEYEGMKEEDVVAYYKTGTVYHILPVQKVSGKLEGIGATTLSIGGKAYQQAGAAVKSYKDADKTTSLRTTANFTDSYDLYIVPDGSNSYYFVATLTPGATEPTPADDIVYAVAKYAITGAVDAYGKPGATKYYVQALELNGDIRIIEVAKATYDGFTDGDGKIMALKKVVPAASATTYPTFEDLTSKCYNANGPLAATAIKFNTNHYFTSDVKFIYVNGVLGDLNPEIKTGVQAIKENVPMEYVAIQVGDTQNYTVSVVFVEKSSKDAAATPEPPKTVYKEVVFANEAGDSTTQAPYAASADTTGSGYVHTVYIDGVKTEILTADKTKLTGFYTISDKVDRLYTLARATEQENLIGGSTGYKVENMYSGLITLASGSNVTDVPVTGATVVNLTDKTVPTNPAELNEKDTVCMVVTIDATTEAITGIVTIYVIASER